MLYSIDENNNISIGLTKFESDSGDVKIRGRSQKASSVICYYRVTAVIVITIVGNYVAAKMIKTAPRLIGIAYAIFKTDTCKLRSVNRFPNVGNRPNRRASIVEFVNFTKETRRAIRWRSWPYMTFVMKNELGQPSVVNDGSVRAGNILGYFCSPRNDK